MKIGIIGSNGFLGKNLSIFLKKKNNVKNFSSYSDSKKKWLVTVCKEIKNYAPDIIINCAASQILDDDLKSIEKLIYSNLYSQSGFLDEAKKQKNFIGFITFGSRWEYNQKGEYQPNSFYAATKHASDYLNRICSFMQFMDSRYDLIKADLSSWRYQLRRRGLSYVSMCLKTKTSISWITILSVFYKARSISFPLKLLWRVLKHFFFNNKLKSK